MRGINKVILVATLGADPDSRAMPSGESVCNFRVAVNEEWKDRQSGEKKQKTEWITIATFGKLAEICSQYLRKASKVYLEGKIRTRKWQDKNGNDRYSTEVVCDTLQMLDSRPPGQAAGQSNQQRKPPAGKNQEEERPDFGDEDIPF